MNKKIRAATVARADGNCEACFRWVGDEGHYDHFWGRKNAPEAVDTGWMLCARCDDDKTNNRPDALTWVKRFQIHSALWGYTAAVRQCLMRLEWIAARNQGTS